ncbi:MAG TPA: DUF1217 domain-containing protein [Alphaproteobacteria bacterium]
MVNIGTFNSSLNSSLLSLFGTSLPSSSPSISALAGYQPFLANENSHIAQYATQTQVSQAVSYFQSHIGQIKSVDQLVHDPKLLKFLTMAFGLDADAQFPAKVAAVLNSNLSDRTSFANNLIDPRYQQLAQEFNVHANGLVQFSNSSVISDVVSRFLTNSYEQNIASTDNPALRDAAYFLRNIGGVTNAYQILADPVLRSVVETVTGLPANIAVQPIQDQARLINSNVNLASFKSSSSSSSSSATNPLSSAQTDLKNLSNATAIVTAAQTSAQSVVDQITAIQNAQTSLATIQNPSGPFASEIPIQQAAAPILIEQQGLLAAGQKALGTVTGDIAQLQSLVTQAGDPNNTTPISTLQAEFTTLANQITSTISGATYQFDNNTGGVTYTSKNLINGSLASAITTQYDSAGHTATVNPQNLGGSSTFQSQLTAALNAFTQATPNLATAASNLSSASTAANTASTSVNTDASNLASALSSVSSPFSKWAGTYNTQQIYLGSQSLSDAGSRLTKINQLIGAIQATAQLVAQQGPSAALSQQYSDYISQLGGYINTTGQTGLDNLLSSAATHSYTVIGGYTIQSQGTDLVTNVLNQLNTLDVSSVANANNVVTVINGTTVQNALKSASSTIGTDSQYFATASTIDPASSVYGQYAALALQVPSLVTGAASNGTNLLDVNQALPITVVAGAARQVINITPESTFNSGVTQTLSTGSQQLLTSSTNAFASLNTAAFNANQILSHLSGELNQLQNATGLTKAAISNLQKQQAKAAVGTAGLPVHANDFAVQFVKKFLALVDAQAAAAGTSPTGNALLIPLFQPIQTGNSGPSLNLIA